MGTISGNVLLPNGQPAANRVVTFIPSNRGGRRASMIMEDIQVQLGNGGAISVTLAEGPYTLRTEWAGDTPVYVPGADATFNSLLPIVFPGAMVNSITVKQGDTINIGGQLLDGYNRPVTLDSTTVEAALKSAAGDVTPFTVTIDSDVTTGAYQLVMAASVTADLPVGTYYLDVKYTRAGAVRRSATGVVNIVDEVTP